MSELQDKLSHLHALLLSNNKEMNRLSAVISAHNHPLDFVMQHLLNNVVPFTLPLIGRVQTALNLHPEDAVIKSKVFASLVNDLESIRTRLTTPYGYDILDESILEASDGLCSKTQALPEHADLVKLKESLHEVAQYVRGLSSEFKVMRLSQLGAHAEASRGV